MNKKHTIKDFLTEYRALCIEHGYLIVTNRNEQIVIDQLNETEIILIQLCDGALRFISIDELRVLQINKQDSSYVFLPGPDEIERATKMKELIFREEIKSQVCKIREKQSK